MAVFKVAWAAVLLAAPALADSHGPASTATYIAQTCLQSGDAAFEHSLQDGLDAQDVEALTGFYAIATFECLGFAMEICETMEEGEACLQGLAAWVSATRTDAVASLPESADGAEGLAEALRFARAAPDTANCNDMTEDQRARYCAVVAEGVALEDAYHAWRLARQVGAMALEGHAPVDLEIIR